MTGRTFIAGATVILVAGAILGYTATVPESCTAQASVPFSMFDPLSLPKADRQAPWLDPSVFYSGKAYVILARTSSDQLPAKEAAFVGGRDPMVGYLKANILEHVKEGIGWLKPPAINFTVNEQGAIEHVEMTATCGNAALDEQLVLAIKKMPRWTPAKDDRGNPIAQEFEFHVVQAACDQKPPLVTRSVSMYDMPLSDSAAAMEHPYDLEFSLENSGGDQYILITSMKLHGGSFYVSPNSTRDFKGKFHLEIANHDHVVLEDRFKEIPRSIEVIDLHPFVNGPVDWVNQDTRYEHTLTVVTKEDFDIGGKYQFTIEPKCTLEVVPFMIKQRSGVLTIERWKC